MKSINKIYLSLFVVLALLLTVSMVSASSFESPDEFREVTCGRGHWDGSICSEWELQDEFNEVAGDIDSVKDEVNDNSDDIDSLESGLKKNMFVDKRQSKQIRSTKHDVNSLEAIIAENTDSWKEDNKGTSMGSVKKFLFGEFVDYLKSIFTTKTETESINDEVYLLRAKFALMEAEYGALATDDQVLATAAEIKRAEENTDSGIIRGVSCQKGVCLNSK